MTPIEMVLERIPAKQAGADSWMACCPAHADSSPSLSIKLTDDDKVLIYCHAGCKLDAVLVAVGMKRSDLFPPKQASDERRTLTDTYHYHDENGVLLYDVLRYWPKGFGQRPANGRTGAGCMDGVRRVLYRLPHVIEAVKNGETVYITEGEKDADRLVREGYCATTAAQGAGSWKTLAGSARKYLSNADVVIVQDNDDKGRQHAADVYHDLRPWVSSVVIKQAAVGKDASDHFDAGKNIHELVDGANGQSSNSDDTDAAAPSSTNLPDEFWQARPVLAHIRQAAHSRLVSPDAVLGVVLARVALVTPCCVVLPALVGSAAPLNTLTALVAASGAGKGATVDVAAELLPIAIDDLVADFTLGSGEGIVAAYLGDVIEPDANGKSKTVKKQVIRGVLAITDEGQSLAEMASRKGSTLMPTLRSAWSGKTLGQGNASAETNRRIPAGAYRFALVVALQEQYAMTLLDDAGGGTPQRFLWLSAEDKTIPEESPEWPNILRFTPPTRYTHSQTPMRVAEPIAVEIRARRLARVRGQLHDGDPLDSHADLVRLKVAALLAILDERLDVSDDDWALAGTMMTTSKAVRRSVAMSAQLDARHRETASNERNVRRVIAEVDGVERHALDKAAATMQRHAQRSTADTLSAAELWRATSSADRKIVSQSDVLAHAVSLGYLVAEADGYRAAA